MNWKLVIKDAKNQPASGTYNDWKEQIAKECHNQCVYCCIREGNWGGIDNFHIDHFRPKSLFADLENDIMNLFYSCPVCNRFKSNDWKNEPNVNVVCYLDPSVVDFSTTYEMDETTFKLKALYIASRYMQERLYLNRPQLIHERREFTLREKEKTIIDKIKSLLQKVNDPDLNIRCLEAIIEIHKHILTRSEVRPYKLAEIRKKKS